MDVIRELLAASGVVLLLAGCLWWLRRKGVASYGVRSGCPRTLQVVERAALSQHHSLHLVRVAGRGLLLGTSPAGCSVLERFAWDRLEAPICDTTETGR